jgi:hypothetical protein
MTLPIPPPEALSIAPPERTPRRMAAASISSSASSDTASSYCDTANGPG